MNLTKKFDEIIEEEKPSRDYSKKFRNLSVLSATIAIASWQFIPEEPMAYVGFIAGSGFAIYDLVMYAHYDINSGRLRKNYPLIFKKGN